MQYKLGKFWSVLGFSALLLATAPSAMATLTVTVASPTIPQPNGSGNQGFFFPTSSTGLFSAYQPVNLANTTTGQITLNVTSTAATATQANFNTSSTGNDTESYLIISLLSTNGVTTPLAPVSLLNCNGNCGGFYTNNVASNYHAMLISPNSTIQVSFNVTVACQDYFAIYGNYPLACNSFINNTFPAGTPALTYSSMAFMVGVYNTTGQSLAGMNSQAGITSVVTGAVDSGSSLVNLNGTTPNTGPTGASPSFACNNLSAYLPGDGQITVDGSQFSFVGLNGSTTVSAANNAPDGLGSVILLAQYSNPFSVIAPLTTTTVGTINKIPGIEAQISNAPGQVITGFVNSTQSVSVPYQAGYIGTDLYGYLIDASSTANATASTCAFPNALETAAILGFLQSSKCFIATAAFRSQDSAPLVLLRAFRDQFLEHFKLGQSFVHWYYHWSPSAAEWLVMNPEFRFPVLLALIPLQLLAWTILHPLVLGALFTVAMALLGYAVFGRNSYEQELAE